MKLVLSLLFAFFDWVCCCWMWLPGFAHLICSLLLSQLPIVVWVAFCWLLLPGLVVVAWVC